MTSLLLASGNQVWASLLAGEGEGHGRKEEAGRDTALGEGARAGMFAQWLLGVWLLSAWEEKDPQGASTQCLTFRKAEFQGQFMDLFRLMPVFWLLVGSPGTPSSPPTPFPRQRQKTRVDTSWTDNMPSPFFIRPPTPPNSLFTECSTAHVVWEGYEHCVCPYAYGLKCARRLCLCVPECEITPSGVLESTDGRAASEARGPGCGPLPDTASLHIWDEMPTPHSPSCPRQHLARDPRCNTFRLLAGVPWCG